MENYLNFNIPCNQLGNYWMIVMIHIPVLSAQYLFDALGQY